MGFRKGSFATVWDVQPVTDAITKIRISTSVKKKDSDELQQDFGGYISCLGSVVAKKAANLKEGDRIRLGNVDVGSNYVKETNTTYYNFKCFSFDMADEFMKQHNASNNGAQTEENPQQGEDNADSSKSNLPF